MCPCPPPPPPSYKPQQDPRWIHATRLHFPKKNRLLSEEKKTWDIGRRTDHSLLPGLPGSTTRAIFGPGPGCFHFRTELDPRILIGTIFLPVAPGRGWMGGWGGGLPKPIPIFSEKNDPFYQHIGRDASIFFLSYRCTSKVSHQKCYFFVLIWGTHALP